MASGPWIKVWRDILNRKIGFLIRRYGHEVLTFWIGVLTNTEEGVLAVDEDYLADICLLESKRYEEIRGIFIERGLLSVDDEGFIRVVNWEEYQGGGIETSSTERVRRFRARHRVEIAPAAPSTPCPGPETDETPDETHETLHETEEVEGDEEEEGERASAREPSALARESPDSDHAGIAFSWFKRFSRETAILIGPSPQDVLKARDLLARLGGDVRLAHRAIEAYFDGWRALWWAVTKPTRKLSDQDKRPDYSFGAFADHITELLAGISTPKEVPLSAAPRGITCPVCGTESSGRINMVTCFTCHFDLRESDDSKAIDEHKAFLSLAIDGEHQALGLMDRIRAAG